jgi:site-specific DNA-methyltransferase (adenine-specific)
LFFLNFGSLAEDKFRPFRVCQIAMGLGFKLNETITWVKNHYRPIQGHRRVNNLTEFIFVLYKGKMPKLDRLAVGVEYTDKSNVTRFAGGKDLKCGGNIWYIPYETIQSEEEKSHNDRFPLGLPEKCIKICGYKINTVLDPFCGSATTGVVAERLGKEFIGIEKNPNVYNRAVERLTKNSIKGLCGGNKYFTPDNLEIKVA